MLEKDKHGDGIFGDSHDSNIIFTSEEFIVGAFKGTGERTVLNEFNKDGGIFIDGLTGRFAASNYFVNNVQ